MKPCRQHASPEAFSLVEVTIAIGIFAFVIVGILGLLPAGMRLRAESAADTRAALITEELLASVRTSSNLSSVVFRDGPRKTNEIVNLANNESVVMGYPSRTTYPFFLWHKNRAGASDPDGAWFRGEMPQQAVNNGIDVLARVSARLITNKLYEVTVEVRSPASQPLRTNSVASLSTLHYSP
jgi:type II secretory pathway pseudopilin PulG